MLLTELKQLLEIPALDVSRDVLLQVRLETAIDIVKEYCNHDFLNDDDVMVFPGGVKHAIKIIVEGMDTNEAIQADSVAGGFSKTYREGGYLGAAKEYLKPYRRVKVIPRRSENDVYYGQIYQPYTTNNQGFKGTILPWVKSGRIR